MVMYFSDDLYREVMRMNYETVPSLEFPFPKPDTITLLEGVESHNSDEWHL
jgi:hypothetical protein